MVGLTYNQNQVDSGGTRTTSDGYQGKNFFQVSQPEIRLFDNDASSGTREEEDVIYLVYGADRFAEYKRTADNEDTFWGVNGAAGVFKYVSGSPDTYVLYDQHGTAVHFFGGNTGSNRADWQLWRIVEAAGNVACAGDASSASSAATAGYNTDGTIALAFDGAASDGRRYTYSYTTIDGASRLTEVKVEAKTGGSWSSPTGQTEVARVTYDYYTAAEVAAASTRDGPAGHLQMVTVRTSLPDSGSTLSSGEYLERDTYFRYYVESYSNTDNRRGGPGMLMMVVQEEATRNYDWTGDATLDDDFLTASTSNLKNYAAAFFEYPSGSDWRPSGGFFNGECGCAGGASGAHTFSYGTGSNYATAIGNTSYDNGASDWARTVIGQPDGVYVSQYFDETGQASSRVTTDADPAGSPTDLWATQVVRDSGGRVTEIRSPANNDTYTHSTGAYASHSGAGLITVLTRVSGGDTDGFLEYAKHKLGTGGTEYFDAKTAYATRDLNIAGSVDVTRPVVRARRAYHTEGTSAGSNYDETTMSYTWWSSTGTSVLYVALKTATTTNPVVTTASNGPNSATSSKRYLRPDGTTAFTETPGGRFDYTQFTGGLLTKRIEDVRTNGSFASGDDPNTDWGIAETGDGWDRVTTFTHDAQGRSETTTLPDTRVTAVYRSRLADQRLVTISFPKRTTGGSTTHFGPASYTVSNQAGRGELSATLAVAAAGSTAATGSLIDETEDDPIDALHADLEGSSNRSRVSRLSTTVHDETGIKVKESRTYVIIANSGAWTGSPGTDYDATTFAYDGMGRRIRTVDPTGTIDRVTYDDLGRARSQTTGTDDTGDPQGMIGGSNNMTESQRMEYDGNADGGNSHLTKVTLDPDGLWTNDNSMGNPDDRRITTYTYDYRGHRLLTTNPTAPHELTAYDNLGRATATALYSSTGSITPGTTDPGATGTQTNRLALSKTFFDEMGRVFKSRRYFIDAADGSDDDTLDTLTWRSADGLVVKTSGERITKTAYDRLFRAVKTFDVIDNDSGYGDVGDVTGDFVLEERQTTYESEDSDNVVMSAVIQRFHDDLDTGTTGALDTNADTDMLKYAAADVDGRIQITAMWHDDLDRVTTSANYGTNGGADFDRDGLSAPASSGAGVLVSITTYSDDGSVLSTEDPDDKVTRFEYDEAGRMITQIANYVNGAPSGPTGADDVFTRFEYKNGLRTKIKSDIDGDSVIDAVDDQITTYIYGTTRGTPATMALASGRLLRAVIYPDSTNTGTDVTDIDSDDSDVVSYVYDALGERTLMKDQAGTTHTYVYDNSGRLLHDRVTAYGSGIDQTVERITTAYDNLGRVSSVSSYDNPAVGSGAVLNQATTSYDGWGNVDVYTLDPDSAVGAANRAAFAVDYVYFKSTTGVSTVRRAGAAYAGMTKIFDYSSAGNRLDDDASRLTAVAWGPTGGGSVTVAEYAYLGVATLAGTDRPEPDLRHTWYEGGGSGSYPALDDFSRTVTDRWVKYGISNPDPLKPTERDVYTTAWTWSPGGDVLSQKDYIHMSGALGTGSGHFDYGYAMDGLHRLTSASRGNWTGSAINNDTGRQVWTLDQLGNWKADDLDLGGGIDYVDASEYQGDNTFNLANELTKREQDTNNTAGYENTYNLTHDAAGNTTDDDQSHEYVWDAWNRLVEVENQASATVAEYTYYPGPMMATAHWDLSSSGGGAPDGTVDSNDPVYCYQYDEATRLLAEYRWISGDNTDQAKYVHLPDNAGLAGMGGSSYINDVILSDRDDTSGEKSASDGSYDTRHYRLYNWRHDVVGLATSAGRMKEWVKYTAYGVPFGLAMFDANDDGSVNLADASPISGWIGTGAYDIRADYDMDSDVDSNDTAAIAAVTMGHNILSTLGNRLGYAGYRLRAELAGTKWYVRYRWLDSATGRWLSRDPLGYVSHPTMYDYCAATPIRHVDFLGLSPSSSGGIQPTSQPPEPPYPPLQPITIDPREPINWYPGTPRPLRIRCYKLPGVPAAAHCALYDPRVYP